METVDIAIDPRILANHGKMLHDATALFRRWLQAMTGGYSVNLKVYQLHSSVNVSSERDGINVWCRPPANTMIERVSDKLKSETDIWWVIAPSAIPSNGGIGLRAHIISGGMGRWKNQPVFISDDAHFVRKASHMGRGDYSEVERRAYQPQWFQHEFMHHWFWLYPELGLEDTLHQWFYRDTWPADFTGSFEPDYYAEAISKHLLSTPTSLAAKLKRKPLADLSQLSLQALVGNYEKRSVTNSWHTVSIQLEGDQLTWKNAAGMQWPLYLRNGKLVTDGKCPYGPKELEVMAHEDGAVYSVSFLGQPYVRVGL